MSEQCELCLNQTSIRVFPCLYHCKKMLCIQHLSEHEKNIEKQIQSKKQLENLWQNYNSIFNEKQYEKEFEKLKIKLENYHKLKQDIKNLLSINHFNDTIENNQKFQLTIQIIQNAIQQEKNQLDYVDPKIESVMTDDDEDEQHQSAIDYSSLSSSMTTNDESEIVESSPSLLNTNGNSPPEEDEYLDDHENSMDNNEISFKDEANVTPSRNIVASKLRGYCPLTHDGVFGINSHVHGIRLCPNRSREMQRTYRLNEHFRRVHNLTPLASLALARAIGSGQDPMNTQLFSDHHIILNIDELRTVSCPIDKPFDHYPLLEIDNSPCDIMKQVRHLKEHLKRVHKFTNQAANIIIKSMKNDVSIHKIQFPYWINILQNDNHI